MPASTLRRTAFSLPMLISLSAIAQTPVQGKAFEVVSIRQNVSQGRPSGPPNLNAGPDGFRVERMSLINVLLTAYTPKAGGLFMKNIDNLPDWATGSDRYDIDARISDADRAAWNDPKNQPAMLQTMLADRFKLAVHREMREKPVYELVVAKGGVKFAETKPDEPRPAGATLPGGGVMGPGKDGATHMYDFSMGMLAGLLSEKSERPVVDKTGLTGRYSIDIREPARMAAPSADTSGGSEDDRMPAVADVLKAVGLELKSAKDEVEYLVIDHVERPTEN